MTDYKRIRAKARKPSAENYCYEGMNSLETRYAKYLEQLKQAGEIMDWRFEPFAIKLAKKTSYTPDFFVVMKDFQIELHEVKGFWRDDARVKVKTAASIFPSFTFRAVQWKKGWVYEEFLP